MRSRVAASIAGLLLSGCASFQYTKADIDGRIVCDMEVMERVERHARRNFNQVIWVNCPQATLRVI